MGASFYLGIVHDNELIRALQVNPVLAGAGGIADPSEVPTKFAFCRFRKKPTAFSELLSGVLEGCVGQLHDLVPGFGQMLAVDSLPAHDRYAPFPYGSREWKSIYRKRVAVERAFGRLKATGN